MTDDLKFEWDITNVSHIARHAVTPEEAEQVLLNDPFDLGYENIAGEERWTSIGHTDHVGVLRGLIQTRTRLGAWKDSLLADPNAFMAAYLAGAQKAA